MVKPYETSSSFFPAWEKLCCGYGKNNVLPSSGLSNLQPLHLLSSGLCWYLWILPCSLLGVNAWHFCWQSWRHWVVLTQWSPEGWLWPLYKWILFDQDAHVQTSGSLGGQVCWGNRVGRLDFSSPSQVGSQTDDQSTILAHWLCNSVRGVKIPFCYDLC